MEISPDTVLRNRYRTIRLLGKGGMGAVYQAYDLALEHEVAVKINQDPNPHAAAQFIAEARLLATLRHPHLPRVIDYFIEGENQFLVMDYIPGDDLKTLLEKVGALPVEQVLHWTIQLGSALTYLHRQTPPIVHRDIKPANLKLNHENEVVLVDFGIAKKVDLNQATATGAVGYTPGYAPPEQYGTAHTGPYSDQYSMAATFYHLLTGQKPVDSIQRVLEQDTLKPVGAINPSIPEHIQFAIRRAMSIRPEDRYTSIEEFVFALTNPSYQPTVRMARNLAASAEFTPSLVLQPSSKKHRFNWIWALIASLALLGTGAVGYLATQGIFRPAAIAAPTLTIGMPPTAFSTLTLPPPTVAPIPTETPQPTITQSPPTLTFTSQPTGTATRAPFAKGRGIAFSSDRADGKTLQIWLMEVSLNDLGKFDVTNTRQLTFDEGDKTQPAWSPDGNKLLYVASGGKSPAGADFGLDIFLLDLGESLQKPVNLTRRAGDDVDPAWSPDGKWIAFTNNGRSDKVKMIDILNVDNGVIQRISVDLQELNPTWSPGLDLAYVTFARENNILYLRSKSSTYKENVFFDSKGISTRTGQVADPAWSPDGSLLAYTRMEQMVGAAVYGDIYSMNAASRGDQITRLTQLGWDRDPAWSPDSQWVVFTSRRDLNLEIYIVRGSGGQAINLTNRAGVDQYPAWRP